MGGSELLCKTKLLRDLRNCYSVCWSVLIWDTMLCNQLKILSFRMWYLHLTPGTTGEWGAAGIQTRKILYCERTVQHTCSHLLQAIVLSSLWQLMLPGISTYPLKYLCLSFLYCCVCVCFFLSFSFSIGPTHSGQVFLILKKVCLALIVLLATDRFSPFTSNI